MNTTLILARHAQTTANVELWISGWRNDVDLTPEGENHASEMGRRIHAQFFSDENPAAESNIRPVGILCSDLTRAKHTAELVNRSLNLPIDYHSGLRERNYGEWTGRKYADLGNDPKGWQQANDDPNQPLWHYEDWAPPGGETLATFRERAVSAIEHGVQLWNEDKFIVVAHRGTIRALLQRHMGVAYMETPSPPNPPEYLEIEWKANPESGDWSLEA